MDLQEKIEQLYEKKKVILLDVHRQKNRRKEEIKLVHEINILADLVGKDKINIDNIAHTLRVYTSLIK